VGFALAAVVSVFMLASGLAVGAPIAHAADCENGAISPPTAYGTYSLCVDGQWQYIDRLLCIDYPDSPYCTPASEPSSSASPTPAPPPPVVAPPPVGIGVDTPNVPYVPYVPYAPPSVPSFNVPNVGCTWVNGYTRKSGVHVSGYYRC
jgi:hypothetical protein